MWLITYFIFLQLESLKLWQHRSKRNIFYQQSCKIVILIIWYHEKVILIHGGREKVIWAADRKKIDGADGRGPGPGSVDRKKVRPYFLLKFMIEYISSTKKMHFSLLNIGIKINLQSHSVKRNLHENGLIWCNHIQCLLKQENITSTNVAAINTSPIFGKFSDQNLITCKKTQGKRPSKNYLTSVLRWKAGSSTAVCSVKCTYQLYFFHWTLPNCCKYQI